MSTALERRTAKLEGATRPNPNPIDIIFRRFIGTVGDEAVRARIGGRILQRTEEETEDAFVQRAAAEALASTERRPSVINLLREAATRSRITRR